MKATLSSFWINASPDCASVKVMLAAAAGLPGSRLTHCQIWRVCPASVKMIRCSCAALATCCSILRRTVYSGSAPSAVDKRKQPCRAFGRRLTIQRFDCRSESIAWLCAYPSRVLQRISAAKLKSLEELSCAGFVDRNQASSVETKRADKHAVLEFLPARCDGRGGLRHAGQ